MERRKEWLLVALTAVLLPAVLAVNEITKEQVGFPARMLLSSNTSHPPSSSSEDHSVTPTVITSCPAGFKLQYQRVSCKISQNDRHINVNVYDDPTCSAAPFAISRAPAVYGAMGSCEASTDVYQSDITKYTIGYPPFVFGNCIDSAVMWQGHTIPGCVSDITVEVYISNACDAFCVPEQHTDPEFNDGSHSECFDSNGLQIADCECHETCSMCGYSDEPTRALDCIQCKDGLALTVLNKENTGTCSAPSNTQCFAEPGGDPIPGCECHASCGACGYGPNPINEFDCIMCKDGDHYPLFPNGTGACVTDLAGRGSCWPSVGGMHYHPMQLVHDCECHETCSACGFGTTYDLDDPQGPAAAAAINNNPSACIACKAPFVKVDSDPYFGEGTGRCVVPGLTYNTRSDVPTTPIPNLRCHESCGECVGPTENDCTSCFNNEMLVSERASDLQKLQPHPPYASVGQCVKPSFCYYDAMNHGQKFFPEVIDGCTCHESCASCGYRIDDRAEGFTLGGSAAVPHDRGHDPTGRNDCVTCHPGYYLNVLELHGTGFCSRTPCAMFCVDVPDEFVWASAVTVTLGWGFFAIVGALAAVAMGVAMRKVVRQSRELEPAASLPLNTSKYGGYGAVGAGAMAVPVETSLNIKSVARRGGEGKGRRRRGRAGGAGAGAGWERKQTTEAEVTSEDSEEDDWVPCVKVYNPRSGGYEQKAATPLTPPGPSPSPSASPSKPKPSTKPPATVHARDRLSGCEMPSSPHIPRAVAAEAAAADGAQARLEAELAAARVKAEQAEDLAEQLRLQAEALLIEKANVRRENATLTREMQMLNERVEMAETALLDTELLAEELEHARQQLERDRAALDAATASQPTHAL